MKNKKQKRKLYKTNTTSEFEYSKTIKIAIEVVLILGLTYFITALATGELKFNKKEEVKEEISIQYEEIMTGEVFNRVGNEYYVLLTNFTDTFASYYLSLIDSYKQDEKSLPFYIVDLEKKVNESYVLKTDEKLKELPNNLSEFKATNPTIIKIKDKQVVERISGKDKVIEFFK